MPRTPEELSKRISEIDLAILSFLQAFDHSEIQLIDNAAGVIASLHFEYVDAYIKPAVHENIDRHKIASLTELLIIRVQPLRVSDGDIVKQREANALLAFSVAGAFEMGLSENMDENNLEYDSQSPAFNDSFAKIIEDHISFLEFLNPEDESFPIVSNAEFWRLIDFVFQLKRSIYFCP